MCQDLELFLLLSGIKVGGDCTALGINPERCPHYDGTFTSICDPILNGRYRELGSYTFQNCDSFAYTGDAGATPFEYGSVDEWLYSENYDMSQISWMKIYEKMLEFAANMEQIDGMRENYLGMLPKPMAQALEYGAPFW